MGVDVTSLLRITKTPFARRDRASSHIDAISADLEANHNASLEIRRHPRARNLTLRVNTATRKVVMTLPRRALMVEAERLILSHYNWIIERLTTAPATHDFADGSEIPLRGIPHMIRYVEASTLGRGVVHQINTPNGTELQVKGTPEHCPRRLKDWLIRSAKKDLEQRVAHHAGLLGVTYQRVSVRDQSSRWGSCSTSGTLSFSWRLIMAPPEILNYVAAHEVAHLKEMNHSRSFWSIVARLCPEYKDAETWLTEKGPELHRYCPTRLM